MGDQASGRGEFWGQSHVFKVWKGLFLQFVCHDIFSLIFKVILYGGLRSKDPVLM